MTVSEQAETQFIENVSLDVAELPDRTSPDDRPDMMLVTAEELESCLRAHLPILLHEAQPLLGVERQELRDAAEHVCWFDWSGNDEDAVKAVDDLRTVLALLPHTGQPGKEEAFCTSCGASEPDWNAARAFDAEHTGQPVEGWRPIETAPNDSAFRWYGLHVTHASGYSWFEAHYVQHDDDGQMRLPSGDDFSDWAYDDFECWAPAPAPPLAAEPHHERETPVVKPIGQATPGS